MSKKKSKSKSQKQSKALAILQQLDTKGDAKNSLIESLKSMVIGVVGGGIAGAAIGKPSLLVGFGTSLTGNYLKSPLLTTLGLGMMASGGYQISSTVNGAQVSGLEGAKERVKAFGENIKKQLYLDKFIKPKSDTGTNGIGEVKYFKYPTNGLDMGALNSIEEEIARSSEKHRQFSGQEDDVYGVEERLY
jgi:hypothetical protein